MSDPDGLLATPLAVLKRDIKGGSDLTQLAQLATEREAVQIVVGLPRSMSGSEGRAAQLAREYASQLADRVSPISVRLVDERLSTVQATREMRQSGIRVKEGREMIDAAAATVILQHALDADRLVGGSST